MKLAELRAELSSRGVSDLPKGKSTLMAALQRLDAAVAAEEGGVHGEQARVLKELNSQNAEAAAAIVAVQEQKQGAKFSAKREKREASEVVQNTTTAGVDRDTGTKSKRARKKKVPAEPPGAYSS